MSEVITGIVLRLIPYQDNNAIITIINPVKGLVTFKARGIFKINGKNTACVQLFAHGEFTLEYKNELSNKTLSHGQLLYYPFHAFDSLITNGIFSFLSEAILKCEAINSEEAFSLFKECYQLTINSDLLTLFLVIMKYILKWNGILLQVDECVYCGDNQNIVGINFKDGGFVCPKCLNKYSHRYELETLKSLRYIMKANIENVPQFTIKQKIGLELINQLFTFIEDNCGLYFKSKEILIFALKSAA